MDLKRIHPVPDIRIHSPAPSGKDTYMVTKSFSETPKSIRNESRKTVGLCNVLGWRLYSDNLFRHYITQHKFRYFGCYNAMFTLVNCQFLILSIFDEHYLQLTRLAIFGVFTMTGCMFQICFLLNKIPLRIQSFTVWFVYGCVLLSIILYMTLTPDEHMLPTDGAFFTILHIFSSYVMINPHPRWTIIMGCVVVITHTITTTVTQKRDKMLIYQVIANFILFICANMIGLAACHVMNQKLYQAYIEVRAALTTSEDIKREYKQQKEFLLSVLPERLANEMLSDMDKSAASQFRKVYMNRHENVSILFADIVGFTALSSKCKAKELVKTLNELFARFDNLAQASINLIAIHVVAALVDCLQGTEAISPMDSLLSNASYPPRLKSLSPFKCRPNKRSGENTHRQQLRIKILGDCYYCICGAPEPRSDHAVMSVYMGLDMVDAIRSVKEKTGADVNMRVGIHTGSVLGGVMGQKQWQFDVLGEDVTTANKMESGGLPGRVHISEKTMQFLNDEFVLEIGNGDQREDYLRLLGIKTYLVKTVLKELKTDEHFDVPNDVQIDNKDDTIPDSIEKVSSTVPRWIFGDYTDSVSASMSPVTLTFRDSTVEKQYLNRGANTSGYFIGLLVLVRLFCFVVLLIVLPKTVAGCLSFVGFEFFLIFQTVIASASNFPKKFPQSLLLVSNLINTNIISSYAWITLVAVATTSIDVVSMVHCDRSNYSLPDEPDFHNHCYLSVYFPLFACLTLCTLALFFKLGHMVKVVLLILVSTWYCSYNVLYSWTPHIPNSNLLEPKYRTIADLSALVIILALFGRKSEELSRRRFLQRREEHKQRENVSALKKKNTYLIYNILPAHVAKEFIGTVRRDDELYCHSYNHVAVMFAACPNFNDFYSEDSVNNDGLECLRFLNEIISDYDELMLDQKFTHVCKIKTVGSTYMAASGLDMVEDEEKECAIEERWGHLDQLLQFALAMKETLYKINAESFNNFHLRIGINHGPVVAGVIGARKPHYDIWGNTVNVASRMESTGQTGKIQVVEETKEILQVFGYKFDKRGLVKVKGKGDLLTYYLNSSHST